LVNLIALACSLLLKPFYFLLLHQLQLKLFLLLLYFCIHYHMYLMFFPFLDHFYLLNLLLLDFIFLPLHLLFLILFLVFLFPQHNIKEVFIFKERFLFQHKHKTLLELQYILRLDDQSILIITLQLHNHQVIQDKEGLN